MSELLTDVVPLLRDVAFASLSEEAFEIMMSCSFTRPALVASAVGWPQLTALVSERQEPLQVLLCGSLAVNLLSSPPPVEEADTRAREEMADRVTTGRFLGYFTECLEASVSRREWPQGSEAYHSSKRLADIASKLVAQG